MTTRITFINEIATVCDATGADITRISRAIGLDHRLSPHFLKAGFGYGGSCFPTDSRAPRAMASNSGCPFQLLNAVIQVNEFQPRLAVQRLKAELNGLKGRRIALLGMTFKPSTDDMREAPSAVIAPPAPGRPQHPRPHHPARRRLHLHERGLPHLTPSPLALPPPPSPSPSPWPGHSTSSPTPVHPVPATLAAVRRSAGARWINGRR
nr:hypothetical protein [Streptomyces sp. SID8359]